MRRLLTMAIVAVLVAGTSLVAAERATFVLTDGERISGAVVFHGPQRTNVVTERNQFGVRPDGRKLVFASNRNAAQRGDTNVFIADWVE